MYCTNSLLLKLHCCAYQAMFILESVYQLWYAVVTDFRTNTCLISITGDHYLLLTCGQYVRYGHFDLDSPQQGGQAYQSFSILAGFWSTDDNWWLALLSVLIKISARYCLCLAIIHSTTTDYQHWLSFPYNDFVCLSMCLSPNNIINVNID